MSACGIKADISKAFTSGPFIPNYGRKLGSLYRRLCLKRGQKAFD